MCDWLPRGNCRNALPLHWCLFQLQRTSHCLTYNLEEATVARLLLLYMMEAPDVYFRQAATLVSESLQALSGRPAEHCFARALNNKTRQRSSHTWYRTLQFVRWEAVAPHFVCRTYVRSAEVCESRTPFELNYSYAFSDMM